MIQGDGQGQRFSARDTSNAEIASLKSTLKLRYKVLIASEAWLMQRPVRFVPEVECVAGTTGLESE
jgi:hypothetical protein